MAKSAALPRPNAEKCTRPLSPLSPPGSLTALLSPQAWCRHQGCSIWTNDRSYTWWQPLILFWMTPVVGNKGAVS